VIGGGEDHAEGLPHTRKINSDELPRDPDHDDVPEELELLAGLGQPVTVLTDDGVGPAALVIVPGLFGHARRLADGELD
jgi:hypothetical protein